MKWVSPFGQPAARRPEPTCCLPVPTTGPVPCRSGLQRRGGAVCRLRGSHRRPLPAARERALLARDLRQVRGVFKRADRDLLLQGPPAVLQARLWEVREHTQYLQQQQQQQTGYEYQENAFVCSLSVNEHHMTPPPHPNSQVSPQNIDIFHPE